MSDLFSPISVLSKLSLQKAQRNFEEAKSFLYNDFRGMAKILSQYNPLEIMTMSLWDERRIIALDTKDEVKKRASVLLPVVLQSLVESDMVGTFGKAREVKEKDWGRIKDLSEDCVRRMVRIIDSMVAVALCKGSVALEEAEGMRRSIEMRLLPSNVDKTTQDRDIWQLRALLEEIPDFQDRMGSDFISFVVNIQNISRMGLTGIDDLVQDVALYRQEYSLKEAQMRASGELDGLDENQVFQKITKKNHWEGRAQGLSERRDGYSLFMPKTSSSLPLDCYAQYSIKAGSLSMDAFLSRGFWPSIRYPFFYLDGEIYSFVAKHIPFFLSLSSQVDRFLSSSRDVLSIFHLSDCDTYVYDGNKVEISILPSVLDVNPVIYPSSYSEQMRRRKSELGIQRKIGHKKLVVDPDMAGDIEKKDDVLYVSSSFLSRATVDKTYRRELLSSLFGNLELPEAEIVYSMDSEDDMESQEVSNNDLLDDTTTDEYEYFDGDEDEVARKLDERDENITLVEYDKTLPTEEEKQSLIERYSLTDEIIRKSEEEERMEKVIEDTLDDDIFDDTEEDEHLDDLYRDEKDEDKEYYAEAEAIDEYDDEEKEENDDDGQLDFFSILDDEESYFDKELEEEDEESFIEEEKREEELDSSLILPGEDEVPEEEALIEKEDIPLSIDASPIESEEVSPVEEESISEEKENTLSPINEDIEDILSEKEDIPLSIDASPIESEEVSPIEEGSISEEKENTLSPINEDIEDILSEKEDIPSSIDASPIESEEVSPVEEESISEEKENTLSPINEDIEDISSEEEAVPSSIDASPIDSEEVSPVEEESISEEKENTLSPINEDIEDISSEKEDIPSSIDASPIESEEVSPVEEEEERTGGISSEKEPHIDEVSPEEGAKEVVLPKEEKPKMSFADSLFAALGDYEEEEDDTIIEEDIPLREEAPLEKEEDSQTEEEIVIPQEAAEEETKEEEAPKEESFPLEEETPAEIEKEEEKDALMDKAKGIVGDIYKILGPDSAFSHFIGLSDEETLDELNEVIESCWKRQIVEGKDKLFNIPDYSLSILLARDSIRDELRLSELMNNAGGVMYSRGCDSWKAIIVYIDSSFVVEEALERTISKESFSASDWKRVTYIGEQMKKR